MTGIERVTVNSYDVDSKFRGRYMRESDGVWFRDVEVDVQLDGCSLSEAIEALTEAAAGLCEPQVHVDNDDALDCVEMTVIGIRAATAEEVDAVNRQLQHRKDKEKADKEREIAKFRQKYPELLKEME